jgi:hypothetical protein
MNVWSATAFFSGFTNLPLASWGAWQIYKNSSSHECVTGYSQGELNETLQYTDDSQTELVLYVPIWGISKGGGPRMSTFFITWLVFITIFGNGVYLIFRPKVTCMPTSSHWVLCCKFNKTLSYIFCFCLWPAAHRPLAIMEAYSCGPWGQVTTLYVLINRITQDDLHQHILNYFVQIDSHRSQTPLSMPDIGRGHTSRRRL